ncbi:MAG: oligopeptide transporter, OPT family [Verrucomicrobia bacterium]|nr:oligopeptide transporter, OPT family [Verrucomicrobiota bacterium]
MSVLAPPELPSTESFIAPETKMRELTWRALITGTVLGMVFGASSLYLTLKVGLTVSASIPVAVISLALFRALSRFGVRDATILEHNITQTAGSAGESIAFGVGVTMPAILILGFDLEITRVLMVGVLGGLLGILMMIPLRRALIVKEHRTLKYPEGTACAAVLKSGASASCRAAASPGAKAEMGELGQEGGSVGGKIIFGGFALGLLYKTVMVALRAWKDVPEKVFSAPLKAGSISMEISPELLGVGYIIGPRIASIMAAGGVLAYLLLIPAIKFFGERATAPVPPGTIPIADMGPSQIRSAYVLYIGAGAVAAGGIVSLLRSLPTIWHGLRAGLRDFRVSAEAATAAADRPRTDQDLSLKLVGIGIVLLILGIIATPTLHMNLLGALLIVIFGFLFVTVSSRLTGEIGSSSNPISGMTVATLLFTSLIFLLVGWTGGTYYVTALSVGAVVCIAASNGGSTSQDLKTGYLLGSTPRLQQIAIMFGAFASALIMGPILIQLNDAATVYVPAAKVAPGLVAPLDQLGPAETISGPQARDDQRTFRTWQKTDTIGGPSGKYLVDDAGHAVWLVDPGINGAFTERPDGSKVRKFDAPKATLVSYIIKGVLDRRLPWALVLLGVMISLTLEMCGVPSLAFAVGVYLPISSSSPIFVGGLVRWLVDRRYRRRHRDISAEQLVAETDKSPGVLLASGYIAGGAIAGIGIAFLAGAFEPLDAFFADWATAHNPFFNGPWSDALSLLPFLVLTGLLYWVGHRAVSQRARN